MANGPCAVLVSGPPASGKSTLGRALAAELGGALLDQDVVTGALTEVVGDLVGTRDLDDPRLTGVSRAARYEALFATAVDNLRLGISVVLVAPFTAERSDPAVWAAARDRLRAAGGEPVLAWLYLPAGELVRRMRFRAAVRDQGKLNDPGAFAAKVLRAPVVEHVAIDATADLPDQLRHLGISRAAS
jgi:predicted kinase